MTKFTVPRNDSVIEGRSFSQVFFQLFSNIVKRLNAAADVDALSGGNETADGTYNQTKQQALIDKVNELTNSLK